MTSKKLLQQLSANSCASVQPLLPLQHLRKLHVGSSEGWDWERDNAGYARFDLQPLLSSCQRLEGVSLRYADAALLQRAAPAVQLLPLTQLVFAPDVREEVFDIPGFDITAQTLQCIGCLSQLQHLGLVYDPWEWYIFNELRVDLQQLALQLHKLKNLRRLELVGVQLLLPPPLQQQEQLQQQQVGEQQQEEAEEAAAAAAAAAAAERDAQALLEVICGLPQLDSLDIAVHHFGRMAPLLAGATGLTRLSLRICDLTDEDVAAMLQGSGLQQLRSLQLSDCGITSAALAPLLATNAAGNVGSGTAAVVLGRLTELKLYHTRVAEATVDALRVLRPGLRVRWDCLGFPSDALI
jgi:hypothetical protein